MNSGDRTGVDLHEEVYMSKRSKIPQIRQHIRDKSTIDHLTSGALKPDMAPRGEKNPRRFTERNGGKLEKAIRKEWTPDKGGLQRF
jgi:hypothetical protein